MASVGIVADLDGRLDEMSPQRTFRDLELQSVERHAIVVADLAFVLRAQDLGQIDARDGDESASLLFGLNGEAGVVGGDVDVAQECVGGLGRRDPGQGQFLGQPILQRAEDTLRAAAGLR